MTNPIKLLTAITTILVFTLLVNTYVMVQKTNQLSEELNILKSTVATPESYDYVIFKDGDLVKAKNSQNEIEFTTNDLSQTTNQALQHGKNIVIQSNEYSFQGNLNITNKSDVSIIARGVTVRCNGYNIIIKGENYRDSRNNLLEGIKLVNGTLRIENSLGTALSSLTFEDCPIGLVISNTCEWTEDTRIQNCKFNNSKTAGIVFETPFGKGTESYSKTGISDCEFWINNNSTGILVEPNAWFNDGYVRDVRMWLSNDLGKQTGILVEGSMSNTYLSYLTFESFFDKAQPAEKYGIYISGENISAPIIGSGFQWLGNYTNPYYNPGYSWVHGVGSSFKESLYITLDNEEKNFNVDPLRIADFEAELNLTNLSPNEVITVNFTTNLIDENGLTTQIKLDTDTLRTLTFEEKCSVLPTRNIIKAIAISAASNLDHSNAQLVVLLAGITA